MYRVAALLSFCAVIGLASPAMSNSGDAANKAPVNFDADNLTHDETGQIITATGHVVMTQSGSKVEADEVVYNLNKDTVVATGHVIYTDVEGNKHYADRVEFEDSLKNGFVQGLRSFLVDGSKFKAGSGTHEGGTVTVMNDASYTPCESCEGQEPLWQIKASEVKHDKAAHNISYKNARFEVAGVPVAYTPYFSHADGTVKRKSGFLTPSAGFKSDLGGFVESAYYWDIAPEKDMTVGAMVMTKEAPLLKGQYRQRWDNARLTVEPSISYSSRNSENNRTKVVVDEELRGNLRADGLWDMTENWRSGLKLDVASDRQYLRQYDFEGEDDVLENQIFAERFDNRDYFVARMLAFQDVRVNEDREDQPNVLPELQANFLGDPNSVPVIGGRWSVDANLLGLVRNDDEQDMARLGLGAGWNRRLVSDYGFVTILDAAARGEVYRVTDRRGSDTNASIDDSSSEGRVFAYTNAQVSYPMSKPITNGRAVIEPIASVTLAPNMDLDDEIPNEDSEDVQLDISNLFEANRFPGLDRIEDQTHVTYGLKSGLYGDDGSKAQVFIGQSYRLQEDDNPFGTGSGLEKQQSDMVGEISATYKEDYDLNYRFQLDNEGLSSERHELEALAKISNLNLSARYLFAKGLEGTEITESREQIENGASYDIDDNWRVRGLARHDLGEDPGLRKAGLGLDYTGQCFSWSVTGERNLTSEISGDSGTEVMFRIGLKNLGEFETTGISVGGNGNSD